jgi:uncharacterized protein YfaS (alpha-2-macroglobulin family)
MPTFERSAALVWTHRALGGRLGQDSAVQTPAAPWKKLTTNTGRSAWLLPANSALPQSLALANAPTGSVTAFVDYESRATEGPSLPVAIERKLYRLTNGAAKRQEKEAGEPVRGRAAPEPDTVSVSSDFELEPVDRNSVLKTDELYLDEITVRPSNGQTMHYGLIEAALPPGASVERSTWGLSLHRRDSQPEAMEKARNENTRFGYAVPIEPLDKEVTIRHLVRFAQRGQFELPPARFHRMYQPEQKAFERKEQAWTTVRVE